MMPYPVLPLCRAGDTHINLPLTLHWPLSLQNPSCQLQQSAGAALCRLLLYEVLVTAL